MRLVPNYYDLSFIIQISLQVSLRKKKMLYQGQVRTVLRKKVSIHNSQST